MSNMPSEIYKNIEIWERKFKYIEKDYIYEPVIDLIINIIEKYNYQEILDYGCGDGRFGYYFKTRKGERRLVGVDVSKEALRRCNNLYDELYLTDGLSIPDKEFDFILLSSVLEHIPLKSWDIFLQI